ncbi:MAG: SGNH/GDSL hydrolase family protein [Actinomycetota bacterium]|nr:SGNH/GDSL hydrolase family protein [Actinomycetota bacterium]
MSGPVLLMLADSLAFHGPERAEPANEPRLWPNIAAAAVGGRVELAAGFGWTARHAWYALTHDPRLWAAMPTVDALVLGVGGMDTLPSPLPTALRELIPVLRPDGLRRAARAAYWRSLPWVATAFERMLPGGGPMSLPPRLSVRYLESCRRAVTTIRPDIPVVLLLPGAHWAPAYGYVDVGRAPADAAYREWSASAGVLTLEVRPLVIDHIHAGKGNPDGIHYGWDAHQAVGQALGCLLAAALARLEQNDRPGAHP